MSTEAKEPGQRAYEAWLGPRHGSAWLELDDDGKRSWAAVEQACAVPAATQDSVDRQQLKAIRDDLLEAGGFEDANCPVSEAVHWAIEELKQLRAAEAGKAQAEWVSIEERLPTPDEQHLLYLSRKAIVRQGFRTSGKQWFLDDGDPAPGVSHWRPLPPPPSAPEGR